MRLLWAVLAEAWSLLWGVVLAVAFLAVGLLIVGVTSGALTVVLLSVLAAIFIGFLVWCARLLFTDPV
jgi:hypothetical protein